MATLVEPSILTTIKKMLLLDVNYDAFDLDVLMHINTAFFTLSEFRIGPSPSYSISGTENEWNELGLEKGLTSYVVSYIYLKTKLVFDPPTNSAVLAALQGQLSEVEWRLIQHMENQTVPTPQLEGG